VILSDEIAKIARVSAKDAKACLDALRQVSARELRKDGKKFKIPCFLGFRLQKMGERPAKVKKTVDGRNLWRAPLRHL